MSGRLPKEDYYKQETDRLLIRALNERDIELWEAFFPNNPALRFLGVESDLFKDLSNYERSAKWINKQIERKNNGIHSQLAVIEKSSGKLIGLGGIIYRNEMGVDDEYEITYSLIPAFQGKGFGTGYGHRGDLNCSSQGKT